MVFISVGEREMGHSWAASLDVVPLEAADLSFGAEPSEAEMHGERVPTVMDACSETDCG